MHIFHPKKSTLDRTLTTANKVEWSCRTGINEWTSRKMQ